MVVGIFYVIVEFCRFGSLRDFLVSKREVFVDTMSDSKRKAIEQKTRDAADSAAGAVGGETSLNYVNLQTSEDEERSETVLKP